MKLILIRHGQTDENVAHRHQPNDTPLSVLGRKQAVQAADTLQTAGVTHVVSSPLIRALQTASLIANGLDIIPSVSHAWKELERPSSLTGHKHFSLRSLLFYKFWFLGLTRSGESYRSMRQRVVVAKEQLALLPEDAVVAVVSHTVFINIFIVHLHRRLPLWPWQAVWVFWKIICLKNTDMIELFFEEGEWKRVSGKLLAKKADEDVLG